MICLTLPLTGNYCSGSGRILGHSSWCGRGHHPGAGEHVTACKQAAWLPSAPPTILLQPAAPSKTWAIWAAEFWAATQKTPFHQTAADLGVVRWVSAYSCEQGWETDLLTLLTPCTPKLKRRLSTIQPERKILSHILLASCCECGQGGATTLSAEPQLLWFGSLPPVACADGPGGCVYFAWLGRSLTVGTSGLMLASNLFFFFLVT